jgi:hypothetical protein
LYFRCSRRCQMQTTRRAVIVPTIFTLALAMTIDIAAVELRGAEVLIGGAVVEITPPLPAALAGQFNMRIAKSADTPLTATAVALETRNGEQVIDQAVFVSCDLVAIRGKTQQRLCERLKGKVSGLDTRKILLNATHTHTGPVTEEEWYVLPKEGVTQGSDYVEFLLGRLEEVVVKAWENRKPGGVSWAFGHAVVGHNRRVVYADGTAKMYGATNTPDFRSFEGYEDHGVEMLFFWDRERNLKAMAVNLACPTQEVEGLSTVNADFWHDTRVKLREVYGNDLLVLPWVGAAGDQSPHRMYRKQAEERMRTRRGLSATQEIARRIVGAVNEVFDVAKGDIRTDVPLVHRVYDLKLPVRMVTEEEAAKAKAQYDEYAKKAQPTSGDHAHLVWHKAVMDRYEKQKVNPFYEMEMHVIRLGDVAIASNPFELFLDYGVQMRARSKAEQTFIIQLAGGSATYLPTEKAVRGGSYSAVVESNLVGPEGGQMLVERTVEAINSLWQDK